MKHKYYLGLYIKKIQEQVSYTRNIIVGKGLEAVQKTFL